MFSPQARTEKGQWWASLEGLWGHRSTFPQVLVCLGRGWLSFALCPYWVLLALTFFLPLLLQCSPPATASADKGSKFKLILCPIPNVLGFPMIKRAYTAGLWQKHRRKRSKQSSRLQDKAWSAELNTWSLGTSNFRHSISFSDAFLWVSFDAMNYILKSELLGS